MRFGQRRSHRIVQGARLFIERQAFPFEDPYARRQGRELPPEILKSQPLHLLVRGGHTAQLRDEILGPRGDRVEARLRRFSGLLPLGSTIVSINVVRIVLADCQYQLDVSFGNRVHSPTFWWLRG